MSEKDPKVWKIPDIESTPLLFEYPEPYPKSDFSKSLTEDEQGLLSAYVESVADKDVDIKVKAATLGIQAILKMRAQPKGEEL